jgi:uncharacterized protein
MIRDDIKTALVTAMKAREAEKVAALRLIQAAIKNRDIEARTGGQAADDDALIVDVLRKMAKQRRESIEMFVNGGREALAETERKELAVIEGFLPAQMDEAAQVAAIDAIATELGAAGPKDMGRVMAALKERHGQSMDMSRASALVKARLAG